MSLQCYTCPSRPQFSTIQDLRAHSDTSIHHSPWPYCNPCSRKFVSESALDAHLLSSHRYEKPTRYTIDFCGQVRYYTTPCVQETTQFHCCDCDRDFGDEMALNQHLLYKVHKKKPTTIVGFFCKECARTFRTDGALQQHLNSVKHKPLIEELTCITGTNCGRVFTSPSAMLHHLESGACRSGIDRRKIDQMIKEKDTGSIITSMRGLEGRISSSIYDDDSDSDYYGYSSGSSTDGVPVYTPTSNTSGHNMVSTLRSPGGILTPVTADELSLSLEIIALSGGKLKCPSCPPQSTRTFENARALWQHMTSPAHTPKAYHCPLSIATGGKGYMKTFTTLSGMTQHLESGACEGGKATFRKSVAFVNAKLRELGFSDMKLIA